MALSDDFDETDARLDELRIRLLDPDLTVEERIDLTFLLDE
jgi:hypothetical protein